MSTPDRTDRQSQLVVDDAAVCGHAHVWPLDFEYGDTCYCGAYYLLRDERGVVSIEETPPRES